MFGLKQYNRSGIERFRIWFHANFQFIIRLYLKLFWKPKNDVERKLSAFSESKNEFRFLQIGANDGLTNDPIIKFILRDDWSGVRVEPLQVPFRKLTSLHRGNEKIELKNCLVGVDSGQATLYQLSFSSSRWATGIASLRRDSLERQITCGYVEAMAKKNNEPLPPDQDTWINSVDLPIIEVNKLLSQAFHSQIDLIQIDAEGYDIDIVNALDFDACLPKMICFEKPRGRDEELKTCLSKLNKNGYQFCETMMDILAYQ